MASLMCGISKEIIQMNLQNRNRNRLTDLEKELTVVGKGGKVEGRIGGRDSEGVCTHCCYFKWITNKDLLYSTWNSA